MKKIKVFRVLFLSALCIVIPYGEANAKVFALLIGVGNFLHADETEVRLPSCSNDVDAFKQHLLSENVVENSENIVTLVNMTATRSNIAKELDRLAPKMKTEDFLLFYFSGHGAISLNDQKKLDIFLVPYDFIFPSSDIFDSSSGTSLGLFSTGELIILLNRFKARRIVLIIDSCHSGFRDAKSYPKTFKEKSRGSYFTRYYKVASFQKSFAEEVDRGFRQMQKEQPGYFSDKNIVILASSRGDEFSFNDSSEANGLFTSKLLQAIQKNFGVSSDHSDFDVSLYEAFLYAREQVSKDILQRFHGEVSQTPQYFLLPSEDETLFKSFSMAARGELTVLTIPEEAQVTLGKENIGTTPLTVLLRPSEYQLAVNKDAYAPEQRSIIIQKGKNPPLSIRLQQTFEPKFALTEEQERSIENALGVLDPETFKDIKFEFQRSYKVRILPQPDTVILVQFKLELSNGNVMFMWGTLIGDATEPAQFISLTLEGYDHEKMGGLKALFGHPDFRLEKLQFLDLDRDGVLEIVVEYVFSWHYAGPIVHHGRSWTHEDRKLVYRRLQVFGWWKESEFQKAAEIDYEDWHAKAKDWMETATTPFRGRMRGSYRLEDVNNDGKIDIIVNYYDIEHKQWMQDIYLQKKEKFVLSR